MTLRRSILTTVMAIGALLPIAKADTNTETNTPTKEISAIKAEKAAKLKEAIHLRLPRDELLKYIDFPDWMPVDKNGQYSIGKAIDMFINAGLADSKGQKAVQNYMNDINDGNSPEMAFQKFATQMAGKDKATQLTPVFNEVLQNMYSKNGGYLPTKAEGYGLLLGLGTLMMIIGMVGATIKENSLFGKVMACALIGASFPVTYVGLECVTTMSVRGIYLDTMEQMHRVYATQAIQKAYTPEIVTRDIKQTKQLLELSSQKSLEK